MVQCHAAPACPPPPLAPHTGSVRGDAQASPSASAQKRRRFLPVGTWFLPISTRQDAGSDAELAGARGVCSTAPAPRGGAQGAGTCSRGALGAEAAPALRLPKKTTPRRKTLRRAGARDGAQRGRALPSTPPRPPAAPHSPARPLRNPASSQRHPPASGAQPRPLPPPDLLRGARRARWRPSASPAIPSPAPTPPLVNVSPSQRLGSAAALLFQGVAPGEAKRPKQVGQEAGEGVQGTGSSCPPRGRTVPPACGRRWAREAENLTPPAGNLHAQKSPSKGAERIPTLNPPGVSSGQPSLLV